MVITYTVVRDLHRGCIKGLRLALAGLALKA